MPMVENFVKKLRVETRHIRDENNKPVRKVKTIVGFARKPPWGNATQVRFDTNEYGTVSVENYFLRRKYFVPCPTS